MASRPVEIGPAGLHSARAIECIRLTRGLTQHQLAARCTAMGRPMTNTALSRTERARRRCDIDDFVTIAAALGIAPVALLPLWTAHGPVSGFGVSLDDIQGALLG